MKNIILAVIFLITINANAAYVKNAKNTPYNTKDEEFKNLSLEDCQKAMLNCTANKKLCQMCKAKY